MVCPKFVPEEIQEHLFGCPACRKHPTCKTAMLPLEDAVAECPTCGRLVVGQYTKRVNELRCACKVCQVKWKEVL